MLITHLSKFNFTDTTFEASTMTLSTSLSSTGLTSRCSTNHLRTTLWNSFICRKEWKSGRHKLFPIDLAKITYLWSWLFQREKWVNGCDISRWLPEILSKNKTSVPSIQKSPETLSETCRSCHSILKISRPQTQWELGKFTPIPRHREVRVCTDWQLLALVPPV